MLVARARALDIRPEDVERALYERRSLARIVGMRQTVFVVPVGLIPTVHGACTYPAGADAGGGGDRRGWRSVRRARAAGEDPIRRGQAVGRHGRGYRRGCCSCERPVGASFVPGLRGGWTSTRYRWAPLQSWLGVDADAISADVARAELARRWLASFGPGACKDLHCKDLHWWTGWTVAQTRSASVKPGSCSQAMSCLSIRRIP
ncbi:MAG: DNA glycosylase AlkZ-like family protein [Egibacteraceae bacterium]